jgi:spore maturation protein CgeB
VRALVVHPGPEFSVSDVFDGWVKGLKDNGLQVATLNLNDRLNFYSRALVEEQGSYERAFQPTDAARMAALGLKAAVYDWWPQVIVIVSAFFVPADFYEVFRSRGHKVIVVHTESPYEDDRQLETAKLAHLNVLNDPTNLERFQAEAPTVYIPHGYDPERHHPRPAEPEYASDFCFVGTGYPSRISFLEQVDWDGLDVTIAGNWQATSKGSKIREFVPHPIDECCPNTEAVKLYTSSKASANIYRRESNRPELSQGWSMTPREVELAATATFFLRDPRGEGDELLPMLPTFGGPDEFGDLLRWWVAHDEERDSAATAARHAVADRTFANHAAEALRAL